MLQTACVQSTYDLVVTRVSGKLTGRPSSLYIPLSMGVISNEIALDLCE